MKYPLFGIIYNWKGLKEENYLYTEDAYLIRGWWENLDGI